MDMFPPTDSAKGAVDIPDYRQGERHLTDPLVVRRDGMFDVLKIKSEKP